MSRKSKSTETEKSVLAWGLGYEQWLTTNRHHYQLFGVVEIL